MSIALYVGPESWSIGSDSILNAYFATVAIRLENGAWGSRFPVTMRELYAGRLTAARSRLAKAETAQIGKELEQLSPRDVVWDAEQPDKRLPWAEEVDDSVTSLADYFVTSDGKRLLDILDQAFGSAVSKRLDVEIG
jgi:hypothetical protein